VAQLAGATLHAARLAGGGTVRLPTNPLLHVLVVRGSASVEPVGELQQGDSARLTLRGGGEVVSGGRGVELLVWAMT
jgi:hypothetical protein